MLTEEDLLECGFYELREKVEELEERVRGVELLLEELLSRIKALEG